MKKQSKYMLLAATLLLTGVSGMQTLKAGVFKFEPNDDRMRLSWQPHHEDNYTAAVVTALLYASYYYFFRSSTRQLRCARSALTSLGKIKMLEQAGTNPEAFMFEQFSESAVPRVKMVQHLDPYLVQCQKAQERCKWVIKGEKAGSRKANEAQQLFNSLEIYNKRLISLLKFAHSDEQSFLKQVKLWEKYSANGFFAGIE